MNISLYLITYHLIRNQVVYKQPEHLYNPTNHHKLYPNYMSLMHKNRLLPFLHYMYQGLVHIYIHLQAVLHHEYTELNL